MALGKLISRALGGTDETRNLTYEVTNTVTGSRADFSIITDGSPGMFPDWQQGEYRGGMGIPAAWRLSLLVANQLGRTPWHSFRAVADKPAEKIEPQPTLLAYPAGSEEPALNVWRSAALDRIWHGNAIGVVAARSPLGYPTSALWIDAQSVVVDRFGPDPVTGWNPPPPGFREGEKGYLIGGRWYHSDEIIHWCGPKRPGQLRGMGVLENHFQTLTRSQALDSAASSVTSAGVPTGLLESLNPDLTQTEADELKASWTKSQRARSVAVLNPSTKFTPIAWNPTETQLLESRQYSITDWANIFGLPSSYAGGQNASRVYANIVDQGMDILRYGLVGDMVAEFEALMTSLLPRGQYVKGNLDHLLRADTKGRYEAHAIALAAKFLTADEVRELEEKPPLTEEQKKDIAEAAAPPVPPGGAGPQPARPTAVSSSPGSGSARPRLAAVRAVGMVSYLMGAQRPDLALEVMNRVRGFVLHVRGYPEFEQHQPRWPRGTGKHAGEWTDQPGGRAPFGAKGPGTWSKGKWSSWESGEHSFEGSLTQAAKKKELATVGASVASTKPDPMSKKSQAEAEFDAFVAEMDANPVAAAKKAKGDGDFADLDAEFEDFLGQVQADVDAKMAEKEQSKPLADVPENSGNVTAEPVGFDLDTFLDSMPSVPDDYYDWPIAKQHAWYDTPGGKAEKDAATAAWDAENVGKAAPGTPWTQDQWGDFFDPGPAVPGQTVPDFVPQDAVQIELIADQLGVTPPPKAMQKKLTTAKQWEGYWKASYEQGMSPGSAAAAAIAADPDAKAKAAAAEEVAFLESMGHSTAVAKAAVHVVPSAPPKSAAELDSTADALGVEKPPKGVGSLSWTGPQWKAYWDGSMGGLSPQNAAAVANGLPTASDDGGLPGPSPGLLGGKAGVSLMGGSTIGGNATGTGPTVGPGQKFGAFEVGGPPQPIAPTPYGAPNSKANRAAKKYNQAVGGAVPKWEASAALAYSGSGYSSMNGPLWADNFDGADDLTKAQITNLTNLLNRWKAPETMTAVRGLDSDPGMPDPPAEGMTYTAKGFQSTSIGEGAFTGKNVVMKITVPKGMPGAVLNGGGLSHFPHEEELVLPHGTRYAITKDTMKGGKRWLEVTAMPPE